MPKLKHLLISLIASASLFIIFSSSTHAASFTVAAGSDENIDNSSCSLTEAIQNINDGAQTNTDCVETGAYGTDDTISLPAGTITLTADLPPITESITIQGQGMDISTIDCQSLYTAVQVASLEPNTSATIRGFTIAAAEGGGFYMQGIKSVTVDQIEVDGTGMVPNNDIGGLLMGSFIQTTDSEEYDYDVDNLYVHDIEGDAGTFNNLMGLAFVIGDDATVAANVDNVTVSNLHATGTDDNVSGIGFTNSFASFTSVDLTAEVNNATVDNLVSDDASASGVATSNLINDSDSPSVMSTTVRNSTVSRLTGAGLVNGGIISGAAAVLATDDVTVNTVSTNNLVFSTESNCLEADVTDLFSGSGTPTLSLTSQGGNLSDDTSCNSYFTQSSDQNNLANLASSLGALGDYGGYVPTIPLLEGSPAIDAGVTIAGLNTDARGVPRPLGLAYDSGAYESPYTQAGIAEEAGLAETGGPVVLLIALGTVLVGSSLVLQKMRTF